jgi:DNA polymerase III, delta subunit
MEKHLPPTLPLSHHLVGHYESREAILSLWEGKVLPPSMLLTGAPSIGKSLLARSIAEMLLCTSLGEHSNELKGCKMCPSCKLLATNNHPDLFALDFSFKESREAAAIRILLTQGSRSSFIGARKVFLLLNSEGMTTQGANSLLKSLEEPRPHTYLILTSNSSARMLSTILSRCYKIQCNNLTSQDIEDILNQMPHLNDEDRLFLTAQGVHQGSVEGLFTALECKAEIEAMDTHLDALERGSFTAGFSLGEIFVKQKAHHETLFSSLRVRVRKRMRIPESSHKVEWATFLMNLLIAERLVIERHCSPPLLFGTMSHFFHSAQKYPPAYRDPAALDTMPSW